MIGYGQWKDVHRLKRRLLCQHLHRAEQPRGGGRGGRSGWSTAARAARRNAGRSEDPGPRRLPDPALQLRPGDRPEPPAPNPPRCSAAGAVRTCTSSVLTPLLIDAVTSHRYGGQARASSSAPFRRTRAISCTLPRSR